MNGLVDIRCPFKVISKKNGMVFDCKRLAIKVAPGSKGQAYCSSCRKPFEFEVGSGRG